MNLATRRRCNVSQGCGACDDDGDLSTTGDQIVADGNIEFEPTVNFSMRIRDGKIEDLQSALDVKETAELKFQIRVAE